MTSVFCDSDSQRLVGYKEFHDFLASPKPSDKLFASAVEQMKYGTRQYAKRQIRWLRNKLLPAIYSANGGGGHATALLPAYLLDATGESTVLAHHISGGDILPAELGDQWTSRVLGEGERIMEGVWYVLSVCLAPALMDPTSFPWQ